MNETLAGKVMKKKGKRKRGEAAPEVTKVIAGYVGKPKGKRQVLWERGMHSDGMTAQQVDDALEACEDFLNEVRNVN